MHLVIDGYGGDPEKLRDADLIQRFLDEYPPVLGMTKIAPPRVTTYKGKHPEDWGVSGFVLIAESHISIHTFPDRLYANIDIFSCREFDVNRALKDVKDTLSLSEVRAWTLERGLEYATPSAADNGIVHERARLIPTLETGDAE